MPDLRYNVVSGRLRGQIGDVKIDEQATSGGRSGSTKSGVVNILLADNPLATHIGGQASRGTHLYGPIPLGMYAVKGHSGIYKTRLVPKTATNMYGRSAFLIHGRGKIGSHGCIVTTRPGAAKEIADLVRAHEETKGPEITLEVLAIGTDIGWQLNLA